MDVQISETGLAEPEPLGLKVHPRRDGKPMSDHVAGHNEQQDKHDDDRTGLEGSGKRREAALGGGGGKRYRLFR